SYRPGGTWNNNETSANNVNVGNLLNRNIEISRIEVILVLLVQVPAISDTDSEPATRINLDTTQDINRIVFKCIWRAATYVGGRSDFSDRLEVLVDREVETDTREQFIRTIQQHEITKAFRVAVQPVAAVGRHVYVLAETTINDTHDTEVTDIAPWAGAALHLVETGEVIALIKPPAIHRNKSHTQWIVWSSK